MSYQDDQKRVPGATVGGKSELNATEGNRSAQLKSESVEVGVEASATAGEKATEQALVGGATAISVDDVPYSIYSHRTKAVIMIAASFMAIVSPLSSAVYYPALNDIAKDLDVSVTLVNLSITTYQIFQGIAPSFVASFSDNHGRRPAFVFCFVTYLAANVGLALQTDYAALMVLRCLQSTGSSGTIALGSAVVADLSTRAERGKYIGYATLGATLGPAFGPLIGGLLAQYQGWRAIFWFLAILAGILLVFTLVVMPETCRAVVGNGSVAPPRWNRPLLMVLMEKRFRRNGWWRPDAKPEVPRKRPNPLTSVRIVAEREAGILLNYAGFQYAGYFLTLSTLTTLLAVNYGYNSLIIGVCYIPIGVGSMASRWLAGSLLDRNFKRIARLVGMEISANKQQNIDDFPIEKARMQVQIPLVYFGGLTMIAYGWVMEFQTNIAGPLVVLFFAGLALSSAGSCLNTLVIDTHRDSPASASAASNLTRCLYSAAATAFALPLVDAIGIGWTGTLIAFIWFVLSPLLWIVYFRGMAWRQAQARKEQQQN